MRGNRTNEQLSEENLTNTEYQEQTNRNTFEGQISGFEYFGGAPHKVIFDNAKVAVKDGFGIHAKVQDRYAALAAHYAFQAEFCNIASGP